MRKGFTMVELLLVMGIFAILIALSSINYFSTVNQTSVATTTDLLVADLRSAQFKAMAGSGVGGSIVSGWGIKFLGSTYVVFPGSTYVAGAPGNYVVTLPSRAAITTTLPSSEVKFSRLSGEIIGYDANSDTIDLSVGSSLKTIELNKYGINTNL